VRLSLKTSEGLLLTSRYVRVVRATAFALVSRAVVLLLNQPAPVMVYKTFWGVADAAPP
jgi:hypothetical protein